MNTVNITLEEYERLILVEKDFFNIKKWYIVSDTWKRYLSTTKAIKEIKSEVSKEQKELLDLEQKLNEAILRDMVKQDELEQLIKRNDKISFVAIWLCIVAIILIIIL